MEADSGDIGRVEIKKEFKTPLELFILICFFITIGLLLWLGSLYSGLKEVALNCTGKPYMILGTTTGNMSWNGTNYSFVPEGSIVEPIPAGSRLKP